jgi:hypothetical protein
MAVLRIGGTEDYIEPSLLWFADSVKRALCKKNNQKWRLGRKYVNHMISYLSSNSTTGHFITTTNVWLFDEAKFLK